MSTITGAIGRILIAVIFIVSGLSKLGDLAATNQAIVAVGLPPGLALPAALFEMIAGVLLAIGLFQRLVSVALIAFVALTTLFYHANFIDPVQLSLALKNLAIIGGLLLVFAHGHMAWGYKAYSRAHDSDVQARDAESRIHAAELRAARAEGRNSVAGTQPVAGNAVVTDVDQDGVPEVRKRSWWS